MDESQFRIEYSWEDLKPVRPLVVTLIAAQVAGCLIGLWLHTYTSFGANLWAGGALATLPGFLLGLLIQHRMSSAASERIAVCLGRTHLENHGCEH